MPHLQILQVLDPLVDVTEQEAQVSAGIVAPGLLVVGIGSVPPGPPVGNSQHASSHDQRWQSSHCPGMAVSATDDAKSRISPRPKARSLGNVPPRRMNSGTRNCIGAKPYPE